MIKGFRALFFIFFVLINIITCYDGYGQEKGQIQKTENLKTKLDPEYWYADSLPPRKEYNIDSTVKEPINLEVKEVEEKEDFNPYWLMMFISLLPYLLIGLLIFLIFYFALKANFNFNFKSKNNKINEDVIVTESTQIESDEQLQRISFNKQIADAEANGNYRLAIRLQYLKTLQSLTQLSLVKFHIKKTNQDYCNELSKTQYFTQFSKCTNYYNYVWFGEFMIEEATYRRIAEQFNLLNAMLYEA